VLLGDGEQDVSDAIPLLTPMRTQLPGPNYHVNITAIECSFIDDDICLGWRMVHSLTHTLITTSVSLSSSHPFSSSLGD
jgi:hypothetical protein